METLSYQTMLQEVEAIVKEVGANDQQVDLDQLLIKVERGYSLIAAMRSRLEETKTKIEDLRLQYESQGES